MNSKKQLKKHQNKEIKKKPDENKPNFCQTANLGLRKELIFKIISMTNYWNFINFNDSMDSFVPSV